MKFLVLLRLSFLLVFLALSWGAAAETLPGKVVRVVDGDTLVLLASGNVEERIRPVLAEALDDEASVGDDMGWGV